MCHSWLVAVRFRFARNRNRRRPHNIGWRPLLWWSPTESQAKRSSSFTYTAPCVHFIVCGCRLRCASVNLKHLHHFLPGLVRCRPWTVRWWLSNKSLIASWLPAKRLGNKLIARPAMIINIIVMISINIITGMRNWVGRIVTIVGSGATTVCNMIK